MAGERSPDPRLLTVPEAARILRIGERTAWRWLAEERMPGALRLGSGPRSPVRVDAAELDAWLHSEPEDVA